MANKKIEEVEGIGPAIGEKLRGAGVKDSDSLLAASCTPKQRKELAEKSGLSEKQILKFANMVDLFRITGIGAEYAELLEVSGVDTVPALARRNAANLATSLGEVNEQKKLTRRVPSASEVEKWIAQAKDLPRMLEY